MPDWDDLRENIIPYEEDTEEEREEMFLSFKQQNVKPADLIDPATRDAYAKWLENE